MTLRPRTRRRSAAPSSEADVRDAGLSLVEIVVAVVLSTLIGGVLVAALGTSMTAADRTSATIASSVDEQLITAFLARDAQAAGGVDPLTAGVLGSLGVSTVDDVAGWAGCVQSADLAVRFAWIDRSALASSQVVVTYALHPDGRLVRRACEAGATSSESVLGSDVTAVEVTCEPVGCVGIPDVVVLTVRGGPAASPFEVVVRASLRPELQTPPDLGNAVQVPLLVTGTSTCPVLAQTATGPVHVLGGLVVADDCGLAPVTGDLSSLVVSGATALLGGPADPVAALAPPATCPTTPPPGPAPAVGSSGGPSSVTIHNTPVTITGAVSFQPGRHVFCAGLTIGSGGDVTGSGVLLHVARGGLTIASGATVSLAPATSGTYAGLTVWAAGADEVAITSGATVHDLRGTVYVPDARVRLTSTSGIRLGALVADRVTLAGSGPIRFGQPSPTLTVAGSQLPDATNLQAYTATAPSVSGGTTPLRYRATGLPTGLVVSTNGTITGVPLSAGTATVSFLVVDATGASVVFTRTLTVTDPVPTPSAVVAQGGDTTASVSWEVSSGAPIVSSTVTATATGQPTRTCTAPGTSRTCTLTGLANGVTYAVSVTATSAQGTSAPATTSVVARPAALAGTGSQLWLDATDPDGDGAIEGTAEQCGTAAPCATTDNVLVRWEDKSGSNNDALQTRASMRPRFVPATSAVDFDANGFLQATVTSGPDLTAFVVAQSDTTNWNTWGWLLASRRPNGLIIHPWPGGRAVGWYPTNSAGTFLNPMQTAPTTIVVPRIYELAQTGSNPIVSWAGLDGNLFGLGSYAGQVRTATPVTLLLGADDIAGRNGDGKYREVIVFSRTLTAGERRAVVEYLGRKWGIAVTPSAPTGVTAAAGIGSVTVAWTAPAWNGGSAVTGTRVTASPGSATCTATAPATTCTVTGLANGTAYTFTAAALNAVGTGEPSAPSNTATPGPPPAPTGVVATAGSRQAVVTWTAPVLDGHAPVTSSTVTATASGQTTRTCTATAPATTCAVTGLTNGVAYSVSVTATNANGTGPAATATVTPAWNPTALGPALTWWFDANDPSALTGAWTTRSGLTVTGTAGSTRLRVSSGVIERIDVIAGGSSYNATPSITISGGGGSGAAVGEITMTSRAVTSVEARFRGTGYTTEPTVTVSGGGGSGAVLRARIVAEVTVGSTIRIAGQTYTVTDRDGLVLTVTPPLAADASAAPFDEFRISRWANRAVPGVHDATQTATAGQPVLGTMSGRPAVVFSGLGSWLSVLDPNGTQTFDHHPNWTVLVAYQSDRQLAAGAVAQPWNAANARVFTSSGGGLADWESNENVLVQNDIGTDSVTGGPVRVGTDSGNGSDAHHWNRVLIGEMSVPQLYDGWGHTGRVGEIIFVNAPMDSQAVTDATAYLTAKWNQPAVVPSAPINVTLTPGDASATVSWRPAAGHLSAVSFSQVTATAPGQTTRSCLSSGTSCTINNLVNGAVYTVTVAATNATGTGPSSVPVTLVTRPAMLTGTNARVWYDAADVDGDGWIEGGAVEGGVSSGRISTWFDKSGRANHAAAPSTQTRPLTTTQTMNGLPVITFDGQTILQGATAANPYGITTDRTLFVVTRRRSGAPSRLIDRTPEDAPLFDITGDNRLEVRDDNGGQYQSGIGTSSSVVGTTHVLSAHRSGTALAIWANGAQTGTSTINGNQTQRALTIGRHVAWSQASDHDVAEVILFDRALTAAERRQIEEYLRLKWSAAIVPGSPTSVTAVRTSGAVTVSWTAPSDGGSTITSSVVTASNGTTCTTTTTSCTFSGLTPGSYTFTVRATNVVGTGAASSVSNTVSWSISRTATIATARPWDGVLQADHVWVTNDGAGTISKISVATNQVVATVTVGSGPRGIASDGTFLWVTNHGSDTVSKVDPVGNRVVATVAVDRNPWGVTFDGRFVWVGSHGADRVSKIDPATNTVVATVFVRTPLELTAAFGSIWVASDQAWRVLRIDPSTNAVLAEIDAGQGPRGVVTDGSSIWVTNYERNTITRVDPSRNIATATITVGDRPVDLATAGGRLWVTIESTDSIVPVDPGTGSVGAGVATDADPLGIVAEPVTSTVWTMNSGGDSVSRFSV